MSFKEDDINLLLPAFKERVSCVLKEMKVRGFDPCLRDTRRTKLEAERNAAKGTGIANSIHMYDAAADVICNVHGWDCSKFKCKFFDVLPKVAELAGCYSGVHFKKVDRPHFQAVPIGKQNELRALGMLDDNRDVRDAFVKKCLKKNHIPHS